MSPQNTVRLAETSFLNHDAVGLIVERLSPEILSRLAIWYHADRGGCRSGQALLERAPIFDTILQETLEAAGSGGARQDVTRVLFGVGLILGTHFRASRRVEHSTEAWRPEEMVTFSEVLGFLSTSNANVLPAQHGEAEDLELGNNPIAFVKALETLDRRVAFLLRVLSRQEGMPPMMTGDGKPIFMGSAAPRLAFFAGLIAAGVEFDAYSDDEAGEGRECEPSAPDGVCGTTGKPGGDQGGEG